MVDRGWLEEDRMKKSWKSSNASRVRKLSSLCRQSSSHVYYQKTPLPIKDIIYSSLLEASQFKGWWRLSQAKAEGCTSTNGIVCILFRDWLKGLGCWAHLEIACKFAEWGFWWNFEPTSFDENQKKIFLLLCFHRKWDLGSNFLRMQSKASASSSSRFVPLYPKFTPKFVSREFKKFQRRPPSRPMTAEQRSTTER